MEDVFVASLMSSPAYTIGDDATLREAGRVLLDHDVGSVVVVDDDGGLQGILTATDFVSVVAGENEWEPTSHVADVMSRDVVTTAANAPITDAADLMVESGHYHVPVVDGETVIGVIAAADLTAYVSTVQSPHPPRASGG